MGLTLLFVPLLGAILLSVILGGRIRARTLGWILAPAPLLSVGLLSLFPDGALTAAVWTPVGPPPFGNIPFGFALDGLSRLFAILILGIGGLVVFYTGYYFDEEPDSGRFFALLISFMTAMTGLVLAGDVVSLFVCWEATTVLSFLLVGFHGRNDAARRASLRALIVTGIGGIALLIGLIGLASVTGHWDLPGLLAQGHAIKAHASYPILFTLVGLGALTKSAQIPFHRWLPGAMAAPTPASAYLHSATMVKAGVFLLMRLHPALGGTDLWFWTLSGIGLATLLGGAWRGVGETDIKALLAQSTVAQLGALVMLAGQDTPAAFKALVLGVTAHALYKSSLFMIAGVVDHAAGTRDLSRLGGLKHALPGLAAVGFLACLSLAGFPPMLGFLAKETLFASVSHPSLPRFVGGVFPLAAVGAGALLIAQAGRLYLGVFEGPERSRAHRVSIFFWGPAALPTAASTALAFFPEPRWLADLFARAATAALGSSVKVSLALWTGLTVPLLLSFIAVGAGLALSALERVGLLSRWAGRFRWGDSVEHGVVLLFQRTASVATALQGGRIRFYLSIVFASTLALLLLATGNNFCQARWNFGGQWPAVAAMGVTLAGAWGAVLLRDLGAIMSLGISGLGVASLMALEPAPDVALVQILADVLMLVLFLAALPKLRRTCLPVSRSVPTLLGIGWGLAGAVLSAWALAGRPRLSRIEPFVSAQSKMSAGASDIVGALVVEFRGFDTLVEITVFALAGLAAWALIDKRAPLIRQASSPLLAAAARLIPPLTLVFAFVQILFGHDRPGDGFTAGVTVALGLAIVDGVHGAGESERRFRWLKPDRLVALGILLVLLRLGWPLLNNGAPLAPFVLWSGGPKGLALSGGLFFEIGIFLSVLGGAARMLRTQGEP